MGPEAECLTQGVGRLFLFFNKGSNHIFGFASHLPNTSSLPLMGKSSHRPRVKEWLWPHWPAGSSLLNLGLASLSLVYPTTKLEIPMPAYPSPRITDQLESTIQTRDCHMNVSSSKIVRWLQHSYFCSRIYL